MSGIVGIFSKKKYKNVFPELYSGLYAIQHRGQESMGISLLAHEKLSEIRGKGEIANNISLDNISTLAGNVGLGYVKYRFAEDDKSLMPMPWLFYPKNSNFKNLIAIDGKFLDETSPEDVVNKLNSNNIDEIIQFINNLKGAYSIILVNGNRMIAIRDPYGIKNLCVGKKEDSYIVASESCVIESIDGQLCHELKPGEIYIVDDNGEESYFAKELSNSPCIFDFVYTARPDSSINGVSVYDARIKMGEILYKEHPVDADIVVGSPDSGLISAVGFSRASNIKYERAIVRNRYINRTFILPTNSMRKKGIRIKLNPIKHLIEGKRVVLVDDSIVRGNTIKRVIEILRESGAKEVHIRIASPQVTKEETFTFDVPDKDHLISNNRSVEEVRKIIGADSLGFISLEGLRQACGNKTYYENCFNGYNPLERI
ncbi:MAG: amidophosphoribosyltransferase [Anaerococcus vaginalis]|uniref:amidophosphoribosyltransferase n=1 Tax=Anaerococcus vaginalis TaxID=33037 RepID=UPI00290F33DC|nr:amidophosphoribosyltransferase [Anaerococcus vaginalis]MDU7649917.1 amidophosphoribosyltransferase [Anaerococcus vaginalis]MDU7686317.1 amidophosphoribosyltransferase [Bacillota bacterium]